ncbi:kinase-like domain-containing protein [Colletotrichum phormii]|uniref:Kinase-like domain-containing protein n=1 Tax=Colletotrichum phormii TaxID=359342 RepID=A0AAJ0EA30_9PEZI|nr:kinase-like domain-containing protein [Colletotrichum phormii]KAK1623475.1 kinase-like domain-containing protein [Colletotrichum phormii]
MAVILETVKSTLGVQSPCRIEFLADGTFNKLYVVESAGQEVVVRVTLPIEPRLKTLSEIATLAWVRQKTSLPVPGILAYIADRANPIGFEWIIMNKIPGEPLADVWKEIPYSAKEHLVRRLALFFSETFEHQMRGIGNIFPNLPSSQTSTSFTVQRLVSYSFIGEHPHSKLSRGPFASSKEWMSARLDFVELDCTEEYTNENEEDDDVEFLETAMVLITRLRNHLKDAFPSTGLGTESTVIFHDNMDSRNILVDKGGNLTAVVDWECVSTLRLWTACQYPPFLQSKPRDVEPNQSIYQHEENGEVTALFWEHLDHYELTQLRRVFLAEMERLQPEWVAIHKSTHHQRDFELAVTLCDDELFMNRVRKWLDDLDSGAEGVVGLRERLDTACDL